MIALCACCSPKTTAMIGASVRRGLAQDGFTVDWVRGRTRRRAGARRARARSRCCSISGLPRKDGPRCARARCAARGDTRPVLIITARDAVADRVAGLDAGADDYLVKPFELDRACGADRARSLRRRAGRAAPIVAYGDIELDPAIAREVRVRGEPVPLSAREFALLEALLARPGAILSRAQLEDKLYGWNDAVESNAVEVHIHALRKKLGADLIRNVRGVGWMVAKPDADRKP